MFGSIPDFVFWSRADDGFGIPLLLFHWLAPDALESYLLWLKDAGYRSLSADDVAAVARGEMPAPQRAVALTFDDGVYNNWAVVAPLLRRHGFRGIAFVVPRLLTEGGRRATLEDADAGRVPRETILCDPAPSRYLTWEEAVALSDEGLLEIQSHTYDHALVFTANRIIDFQHPRPDGKPRYPWLWTAVGADPADPLWGAPVYPTAPRMAGRRYHDDASLRDACQRFVAVRGERGFFADPSWRGELERFVTLERRRFGPGRLESATDTTAERLRTLHLARQTLTARLGRPVDHCALPWMKGAPDAPRLLREAGYRTGYTTERPSFRVRSATDPFDLGRVEGYWLRSLPGPQRVPLARRVVRHLERVTGYALARR